MKILVVLTHVQFLFRDRCTLKPLKVKCNLTNKKILALWDRKSNSNSVRFFVNRLIREQTHRTSSKMSTLCRNVLSCHSLTLATFKWLINFNGSCSLVLKRVSLWKCYISPFQCKTFYTLNAVILTYSPSVNCPSVESFHKESFVHKL